MAIPKIEIGPLRRGQISEAQIPGISPGVYSDADFRAISRLLHQQAGIVLPKGKAMLVLPKFVHVIPIVRALPIRWFDKITDFFGVNRTMDDFRGRA